MKFYKYLLITLALLTAGFSQTPEYPEGPWTTVFDGTSLDGWEYNGDPPWHLEDGLLKVSGGTNKTYLIWPEPLKNMELQVKYKLSTDRANSGIQVRSVCQDRSKGLPNCDGSYIVCGPQLDVALSYSGRLFEECVGFLMFDGGNIDNCRRSLSVGDWMVTTARFQDDQVSLWFNGEHCLDYTLTNTEHLEGDIFAIQSHPPFDLIEWEYIKIRDLDAPVDVPGCMNANSANFNPQATVDDSSCQACTNPNSSNFDTYCETNGCADNGTCLACTDLLASNYDSFCDIHDCVDNGSCVVSVYFVLEEKAVSFQGNEGAVIHYSVSETGPFTIRVLDTGGNELQSVSGRGPVLHQQFMLPGNGIFFLEMKTLNDHSIKKILNF